MNQYLTHSAAFNNEECGIRKPIPVALGLPSSAEDSGR